VRGDALPRRARIDLALTVALAAGLYIRLSPLVFPPYTSDFDQLVLAARAWRTAGGDPYTVVLETHRRLGLDFGLVYPFPAVVAALPFSFASLPWARAIVGALGAGCLTYLTLGRAWWLFPILLSGAFRSALSTVQIAPFAACAVLAPAFGWVLAYKPNVGLATLVTGTRRQWFAAFLGSAALLTIISLALWPSWVPVWWDALRTGIRFSALITAPFGWLLLLALLRWRRPEARWLLVTALIPGTPGAYDALPLLLLLPQSFRQALVFALLSHAGDLAGYVIPHGEGMVGLNAGRSVVLLGTLYLPALIVILARPNVGPSPAWAEWWAKKFPPWVRGVPE